MKFNARICYLDFNLWIHSNDRQFFDLAVNCFQNFQSKENYNVNKRINIYLVKKKALLQGRSDTRCWKKNDLVLESWSKETLAKVNYKKRIIRSFLSSRCSFSTEEIEELLIFQPLRMVLRTYGMFVIHSGCVAKNNDGILIVGKSGSGKTTTTLGLVRKGLKFLSDEHVVLKKTDQGIKACSFPRPIGLKEESINVFAKLAFLKDRKPSSSKKKRFFINEVDPYSLTGECRPRLIIFPQFKKNSRLRIRKISKTEAGKSILHDIETCGAFGGLRLDYPELFRVVTLLVDQTTNYKATYSKNNFQSLIKLISSEKFRSKR